MTSKLVRRTKDATSRWRLENIVGSRSFDGGGSVCMKALLADTVDPRIGSMLSLHGVSRGDFTRAASYRFSTTSGATLLVAIVSCCCCRYAVYFTFITL
jgi:hypothetical protein